MISFRKFIVELDGRAVYASKSYKNAQRVAWQIIYRNPCREVIVHLGDIICGI